jgi:hypothetical protein
MTKESTSSGVGGNPVKSNVTRRIKCSRFARGAGASPTASRRARMKQSIGFVGPPTDGTTGRVGGFQAQ